MTNRQKERTRAVIRVLMVFVAVILLVVALGIPVANNAVALSVQRRLESLPLPEHTTLEEATSVAGKLAGSGNGMQYFGAVLLHSELSLEELSAHYIPHRQNLFDCVVEKQTGAEICPQGEGLVQAVAFSASPEEEGWYVLYSWGSAPKGLKGWLDLDLRGR